MPTFFRRLTNTPKKKGFAILLSLILAASAITKLRSSDNPPSPGNAPPTKIYFLLGQDFSDPSNLIATNTTKGTVAIRYDEVASLARAVECIAPPANVILAAHGSMWGTFRWSEKENEVDYKTLFKLLPRKGIESITIESCFGGIVTLDTEAIKQAPPGTPIHTFVSAFSPTLSEMTTNFNQKLTGQTNRTDLMLRSLLMVEPVSYRSTVQNIDAREHKHEDPDPMGARPSMIAMGGGAQIDLDKERKKLSKNLRLGRADRPAWSKARDLLYSTLRSFRKKETLWSSFASCPDPTAYTPAHLFNVIDLMETNEPIGNLRDRDENYVDLALANALTAAYLDVSNELETLRQEAVRDNPTNCFQVPIGNTLSLSARNRYCFVISEKGQRQFFLFSLCKSKITDDDDIANVRKLAITERPDGKLEVLGEDRKRHVVALTEQGCVIDGLKALNAPFSGELLRELKRFAKLMSDQGPTGLQRRAFCPKPPPPTASHYPFAAKSLRR